MKTTPKSIEPQKYVKFYFENGFIKTDTNLTSLEILGVIERVKYSQLAVARINAEAEIKRVKEEQIAGNWSKLGDSIKFKTYTMKWEPGGKTKAKKKAPIKKKIILKRK